MEQHDHSSHFGDDSGAGADKVAIQLALDEIRSPDIVRLRKSGEMMPELNALVNAFVQAATGVERYNFRGLLRVDGYAGADRRHKPMPEQTRYSVQQNA